MVLDYDVPEIQNEKPFIPPPTPIASQEQPSLFFVLCKKLTNWQPCEKL
jgi:hypothetical protein